MAIKITKFIPLREFAKIESQAQAARWLGVTQGYISQALRANKPIFVRSKGAAYEAVELRLFGEIREPTIKANRKLHRLGEEFMVGSAQ